MRRQTRRLTLCRTMEPIPSYSCEPVTSEHPRAVQRGVGIALGLLVLVLAGTLALVIPGPVPLQTLSTEGPHWIGDGKKAPPVLASISLTELASLVQAVPSQPTFNECGHPRYAWERKAWCWDISNVPSNSLLLAVLLSPHGGCVYGTLKGATLSVRTLTINVNLRVHSAACLPTATAAAMR